MLDAPIALAYAEFDAGDDLAARVDSEEVDAERVDLPFLEQSEASGRLPRYGERPDE
jgi:aminomethyltransferase